MGKKEPLVNHWTAKQFDRAHPISSVGKKKKNLMEKIRVPCGKVSSQPHQFSVYWILSDFNILETLGDLPHTIFGVCWWEASKRFCPFHPHA